MDLLIAFLRSSRIFLAFLLLEFISLWFVIRNNNYQSATSLALSNALSGSIYNQVNATTEYLSLAEVNEKLKAENARLHAQLNNQASTFPTPDSSSLLNHYSFVPAKEVYNSIYNSKNYIIIDKGLKDGISEGMGVVTTEGIIGKVKASSNNFSTIISILHSDLQVSARVHRKEVIGTLKWDTKDYRFAKLAEVGQHIKLQKGDTIVTSGFNTLYPAGYPIGKVEQLKTASENAFWDITVKLATNFSALKHVYVVRHKLRPEYDSLHQASITD